MEGGAGRGGDRGRPAGSGGTEGGGRRRGGESGPGPGRSGALGARPSGARRGRRAADAALSLSLGRGSLRGWRREPPRVGVSRSRRAEPRAQASSGRWLDAGQRRDEALPAAPALGGALPRDRALEDLNTRAVRPRHAGQGSDCGRPDRGHFFRVKKSAFKAELD